MSYFPIFLSVVIVVKNNEENIKNILEQSSGHIKNLVSDYEFVVVDNASTDNTVGELKELTQETGLPNLQVYALTKEVEFDIATWAGMESSLGDFVAAVDLANDDISVLPQMLEEATAGADVVFMNNEEKVSYSFGYSLAYSLFNRIYSYFNGLDLAREAPSYRVLSKKVVNFILQYPSPAISYRHLPATGGFIKKTLTYRSKSKRQEKSVGEAINRGVRLLVSTTRGPMRIVTLLCLLGGGSNLVYSLYVLLVSALKNDVASGWASLSLQQSSMFFLISIVLLILSEYIIHMVSLSTEGPLYHVAAEFNSAIITRREKLNIEEVNSSVAQKKGMTREQGDDSP